MRSYLYLPYTIDIFDKNTLLSPADDELCIIYVLSGVVTICGCPGRTLHEMDIFSDNSLPFPQRLDIRGAAAVIRLDHSFVASCNDFKLFFVRLDSSDHTKNNYTQLNRLLMQLTHDYFSVPLPSRDQLYANGKKLIEEIFTHFPWTLSPAPARSNQMKYLLYHCYPRTLTLTELSAELKISPQYASVYTKHFLQMPLTSWLTARRLKAAQGYLKYTDDSITDIVAKCGFANFNAFNRAFHAQHGSSATAAIFRAHNRNTDIPLSVSDHPDYLPARRLYDKYRQALPQVRTDISRSQVSINTDTRRISLLEMPPADIIQFGINDLISARQVEYMKYIRQYIPIRYVRFGGLLELMEISEDTGTYTFQEAEKVLLNLIRMEVYPIITFIVSPKADIAARFRAFMDWLCPTFGLRRIRNWQFEYILDGEYRMKAHPDPGELTAMAAVIETITRCVKEVSPDIKVGNGMFNTNFPVDFGEALLPYLQKAQVIPDFFALQLYASVLTKPQPDLRTAQEYTISANRYAIYQKIKTYRNIIRNTFSDRDIPLYAQICFSLLKNNILNESLFAGAFLLDNMLKAQKYVSHFTLPIMDDSCHFIYKYNDRPYQGIFSLLTANGIPKPLFFAIRLLQDCGNLLIDRSEDYLVTTDIDRSISILLVHYIHPDRFYCLHPQNLKPKDIYTVFSNPQPKSFDITLTSPAAGSYLVEEWCLDTKHGSVFDLWLNSGNAQHLPLDIVEHIKESVHPGYTYYQLKTREKIVLHEELSPHEIRLIRMRPQ